MLQIKSYFKRRKMVQSSSSILFHTDILRAFKSQTCFEQKSTRDPRLLYCTRIKSKRNSLRLDMHQEAKNCDLSLGNVANGQPFVSRLAALKRAKIGHSRGSSYIRRLHYVPAQKILSSLRMVQAIHSKNYCHLPGAIHSITIANF